MSVPPRFRNVLCLDDFKPLGEAFLPRVLAEFIASGVEGNLTYKENLNAFDKVWLKPRVLNDVSKRTMKRKLFGKIYDAPFGIPPMGASAMFGFEADLNNARAAKEANIPFCMSGSSLIPMEKVLEVNSDVWFQAYIETSKERIAALTDRAQDAGCKTLVITVDVAVGGNRASNMRSGFNYPIRPNLSIALDGLMHPRWFYETLIRTVLKSGFPHMENMGVGQGIPMISFSAPERKHARDALAWEDLKWLRDRWKDRLLIKGVLSGEDARIASEIGLDGLFVSNHGGRQLDTAVSPLTVLAEIVAQKGKMAILYDGGIRRGTDVIKALALGADMTFVGRPFLYAVALGEQPGLMYAIHLLQDEIHRNLALLGCDDLNDLASRIVT